MERKCDPVCDVSQELVDKIKDMVLARVMEDVGPLLVQLAGAHEQTWLERRDR